MTTERIHRPPREGRRGAASPPLASRRQVLVPLLLLLACPAAAADQGQEEAPPILVIALDSIPYRQVVDLTDPERGDDALFRGLKGPVPLVTTFPATTSVAMGGILGPMGLEASPGYEARFFDWEDERKRGGGLISYFRIDFPWRKFFPGLKGPVRRMLWALRPVKASRRQLRRSLEAFAASDAKVHFVYLGETDLLAHQHPERLELVLRELDRLLQELRARQDFRVVLFSDHGIDGGEPLKNTLPPIKRAVRQAGFDPGARLRSDRDVVFTPFGLVSSFEAYARPGAEEELAGVLAGVEGVDLCITRVTGRRFLVHSDRGSAAFEHRPSPAGELWSYTSEEGDPLRYLPEAEDLRRRSGSPEQIWFPDRCWFEATRDHHYPDALYRLARSFDVVENPASIVCSLEPGHMFGARKTEVAARLGIGAIRWTHGALDRRSTLGFVMSDLAGWSPPRAARFDRALDFLVEALGDEAGPPGSPDQTVPGPPTAEPGDPSGGPDRDGASPRDSGSSEENLR